MTPPDAVWDAWNARVRTKLLVVLLQLGLLAFMASFMGLMSTFAFGFGGLLAGIAGDWRLAGLAAVFPLGCGAVLALAFGLVVADVVRAARSPATLFIGRIERARFEPGMGFGEGRARFLVDLAPQEVWELRRDRTARRCADEPSLTVRTLPGVGKATPEGEQVMALVLADGVCCWTRSAG